MHRCARGSRTHKFVDIRRVIAARFDRASRPRVAPANAHHGSSAYAPNGISAVNWSHKLVNRGEGFFSVHSVLTLLLAAALIPAFRLAKLPLAMDILGMASAYWVGTAVSAV